jgi:formate dehydrogenase iron-sulfur subunit
MSTVHRLSRRDFLRTLGGGVAAALFAQFPTIAYANEVEVAPGWGLLIDVTRCVGCNACARACKAVNGLSPAGGAPQALDSDTYTFVDARTVTAANGQVSQRYVKRQCMHCLDAACVSACPAAAMVKSSAGPVVYHAERCLGCRYCQIACPFDVPRFEWDNGTAPAISKCWLCYDRLQDGKQPACAEACPSGALRFGRREDLLAQAHGQIVSNPGRYLDHVYGETEVGGTSMLYLSDVPFEQLGLPANLPQTAPPQETEKIMSTLPYVIAGVACLMTGTAAYTHRRPATSTRADGQEK